MLLCEEGWREAMVGTISLYDAQGERHHTIYLGATPEYGKASFIKRLEHEIDRIKERYPNATYVGIADGAESNWRFLRQHTTEQILDFYHASGYLGQGHFILDLGDEFRQFQPSKTKIPDAWNGAFS
jgi:hypothetical protein